MKTFEIHLYQRGKWNIDSSFDDRELALFEARRIEESGRYVGIRVIEEVFDEATQQVSNRTIFRGARLDQLNADKTAAATGAPRRRPARQPGERLARRKAGRGTRTAPAGERTFSPARFAALLLLVLAAAAVGALWGIQYLQSLL